MKIIKELKECRVIHQGPYHLFFFKDFNGHSLQISIKKVGVDSDLDSSRSSAFGDFRAPSPTWHYLCKEYVLDAFNGVFNKPLCFETELLKSLKKVMKSRDFLLLRYVLRKPHIRALINFKEVNHVN
jgi:hypothetical protein